MIDVENVQQIINISDVYWDVDSLINGTDRTKGGMLIPFEKRTKHEILSGGFSMSGGIFFSNRTEWVPTFMIQTMRHNPSMPFTKIMIHDNVGGDMTPRLLNSYKAGVMPRSFKYGAYCYTTRGMTLVNKHKDDDETSIRIVYTLVMRRELFEEAKKAFDSLSRKDSGSTSIITKFEKQMSKIINDNFSDIEFWIDDQLYNPSNIAHMKYERLKIKRIVLPPVMKMGIKVRYVNQFDMQSVLCPFSSDAGKFSTLQEMQEDTAELVGNALDFFREKYA